jgi:hypothetical protein
MDPKTIFETVLEERVLGREGIVKTLNVVENFIKAKGLMLYGGIAIDLAIKIVNDGIGIYSDSALPDYDFRSCFNYEDAIELATKLYKLGMSDVQCINAKHVTTRRVRTSFVWVADITYVPPNVVDKIPTINANGFLITHPDFQRCDIHSSLSFLLEGAPREVILHRYKKDTDRLRLLDSFYPMSFEEFNQDHKTLNKYICKPKGIISGMAALSYYKDTLIEYQNGDIEYETNENILTYCLTYEDIFSDVLLERGSKGYEVKSSDIFLEPFFEIRPPTILNDKEEVLFYPNYILCYNETSKGTKVVSHQHLMLYFISKYFEMQFKGRKSESEDALRHYCYMFKKFPDFIKPMKASGISSSYSAKVIKLDYMKALGIQVDDIDRVPNNNMFHTSDNIFPSNDYVGYFYRMSGNEIPLAYFNLILKSLRPVFI